MRCVWCSPEGSSLVRLNKVSRRSSYTSNTSWYLTLQTTLPGKQQHLTYHPHAWWWEQPLTWHRYLSSFSGQYFQYFPSKAISCFVDATWPAQSCSTRPLALRLCEKHYAQVWRANIDNLTERIWERIQGITKEVPQCVMTSFPLWLQKCSEWSDGQLRSVKLKQ